MRQYKNPRTFVGSWIFVCIFEEQKPKKPLYMHTTACCVWCPREDSNLHGVTRQYLKLVRLPIPPPGQRSHAFSVERGSAQHENFVAYEICRIKFLVPRRGLEPPRSYPLVPETSASTNSATWAKYSCFEFSVVIAEQPYLVGMLAHAGLNCWCPREDSNLHGVTR